MRFHDLIEFHGRDQPDAIALRDGERSVSYGELLAESRAVADALVSAGLGPGDRYGVLAGNCLEYFSCYLGAAMANVVTVPLNPRLAPAEWEYIVNDAACRLIVARNELIEPFLTVRERLPGVDTCVAIGDMPAGWTSWSGWLADAPERPGNVASIESSAATVQMYTSGTTGRPKGAILTHGSLTAAMVQNLAPLTEGAKGCTHVVAPLAHVGSALAGMQNLFAGGSVYVQEHFDFEEVARILDEEGVNRTMLVPAMIQALLVMVPGIEDREYADLDQIGYGASPIAAATLRKAMDAFGCEFVQGFGQTESSGGVTLLTRADHRRALDGHEHLLQSAGRACFGTDVRVVDPDGNDCAVGEVGHIIARGPQLMAGYWNLPEATAEALRDGWLYLGDAGTFDDEGYLYVKDRIKDMVVSGGENVYPAEVEQVLFEHPDVADAAVIGVPDEKWGEAVKAFVVLVDGAEVTEEELIDFCRSKIAGFKVPKSIDWHDVLPRNASMKVLRTELRAPYWDGHDRSVG